MVAFYRSCLPSRLGGLGFRVTELSNGCMTATVVESQASLYIPKQSYKVYLHEAYSNYELFFAHDS